MVTYTQDNMTALISDNALNNYVIEFNPSRVTFEASEVGSGKAVAVTLTNRLRKSSVFTLYFEVEGKD